MLPCVHGNVIDRIDVQTGEVTTMIRQEHGQSSLRPEGWSPDGKTLYVSRVDTESKKWLVLAHDLQSGREREILEADSTVPGHVAISPDGRLLAVNVYLRNPRSMALLVAPEQGGNTRELLRINPPEGLGGFLAWSPDGSSILYRKLRSGSENRAGTIPDPSREVWSVSREGGAPRRVALDSAILAAPTISPDGRHIASTRPSGGGRTKPEVWVMENFLPLLRASR